MRAVGFVLMAAVVIELTVALLLPSSGSTSLSGWGALFVLLIEVCAFLLPPLLVAKAERADLRRTFRLCRPPWRFALPVLLAAPALSTVLYYLQEYWARLWKPIFPLEPSAALTEALTTDNPWQVVFLVALVGVVPAISEEFFFRGFILSGLTTRMRLSRAIALTAVLFAGMHFDFYGVPTYLVLGIWFGMLAVLSRSLFWPVTAHLLHNGLEVVGTNYMGGTWPVDHAGWLPLVAGSALVLVALWLRTEIAKSRRRAS